jgi:hypothetical protein
MLYRFVSKIVFLFMLLGLSNSFLYANPALFWPIIPRTIPKVLKPKQVPKIIPKVKPKTKTKKEKKDKDKSVDEPDFDFLDFLFGSDAKQEKQPKQPKKKTNIKWLDVSSSTCKRHGGNMDKGVCVADWQEAKKICSDMSARLPTIDELKAVPKICGGTLAMYSDENWDSIVSKNINNSSYKSCYNRKGFSDKDLYWSSTSFSGDTNYAWVVHIGGVVYYGYKDKNAYLRCVRAGK